MKTKGATFMMKYNSSVPWCIVRLYQEADIVSPIKALNAPIHPSRTYSIHKSSSGQPAILYTSQEDMVCPISHIPNYLYYMQSLLVRFIAD